MIKYKNPSKRMIAMYAKQNKIILLYETLFKSLLIGL